MTFGDPLKTSHEPHLCPGNLLGNDGKGSEGLGKDFGTPSSCGDATRRHPFIWRGFRRGGAFSVVICSFTCRFCNLRVVERGYVGFTVDRITDGECKYKGGKQRVRLQEREVKPSPLDCSLCLRLERVCDSVSPL